MDEQIKVGDKFRHFKGNEKIYEIIAIAKDCEKTNKELVVYKSLYSGDFPVGTVWVRPLEDFIGFKEFSDGRKVKRFEKIK